MRLITNTVFFLMAFSLNAQRAIPYSAPKVTNLASPYTGDFYMLPTLRHDVSTNFFSNHVKNLCSDIYGRIWFVGNNSGFGVIDGQRMYQFGSNNGFFDRQNVIYSDINGGVWVGGNGTGVYHLSQPGVAGLYVNSPIFKTGDTTAYDIGDVHINCINGDQFGNVYIGTGLNGLTRISQDSITIWGVSNGKLPETDDTDARFITIDENNCVWFTHDDRIYYIENDLIKEHKAANAIGKTSSLSLNNHEFILAFIEGKPYRLTKEVVAPLSSQGIQGLNFAQKGPDGTIYLRSNHEIFVYDHYKLIKIFDNNNDFNIRALTVDNENNIWLATGGYGLICIPSQTVKRFTPYKTIYNYQNTLIVQKEGDISELQLEKDLAEKLIFHFSLNENEQIKWTIAETDKIHYHTNQRYLVFDKTNGSISTETDEFYLFQGNIEFLGDQIFLHHYKTGVYWRANNQTYFLQDTSDLGVKPLFWNGSKGYFLLGPSKMNSHLVKWENGSQSVIMENIGGDSLKITNAFYINDSTFRFATWGSYLMEAYTNSDSAKYITKNLGSNIIWGPQYDKEGNGWLGGIEGGVNYIDIKTGVNANYSLKDGFPNSRISGVGISYMDNDVFVSSDEGVTWFRHLSDKGINSAEEFYHKFKPQLINMSDGLYGEGFNRAQKTTNGLIIVNGEKDIPQIIDTKKISNSEPNHLHFSAIKTEDDSRNIQYLYQWYPGTLYQPITEFTLKHKENLLVEVNSIYFKNFFNQKYAYRIDALEWSEPSSSNQFRLAGLASGKHSISFIAYSENGLPSSPISFTVNVEGAIYESVFFWIVLIIAVGLIFYFFFRWRTLIIRKRAKVLEQTVKERTSEIELQKKEIETQHEEIKDSINYAKRLQDAILPSNEIIRNHFKDAFVFFRPKDVVSGDFYWFENYNNRIYFAVADCTGHGVPGALVSVVCSNALNRTLNEFNIQEPAEILNKTRELVINTFSKSNFNVKDGMDIALCCIENDILHFAGANNPLWLIRSKDNFEEIENTKTLTSDEHVLIEIKGNKQPVGLHENSVPFTQKSISIQKGDIFYLFSDGYPDQFGGENHSISKPGGKKLKYKPFKKIILEINDQPLSKQGEFLETAFDKWKGSFEQVDDVCVIGFKVL